MLTNKQTNVGENITSLAEVMKGVTSIGRLKKEEEQKIKFEKFAIVNGKD